jgi:hypothetical protein
MQDREHDEELVQNLRKFRPRAIRPLEQRRTGNSSLKWLTAAAAVGLAGSMLFWYTQIHKTKPLERIVAQTSIEIRPQTHWSTPALTKLALDDGKAFDALLADESRNLLPSMRGERSALRVLAKE